MHILRKSASLAVALLMASSMIALTARADDTFRAERRALPEGFHDWSAVRPEHGLAQTSSGSMVLCRDMTTAIALGARQWEGMDPFEAARAVARARPGQPVPCRMISKLRLTPVEVAVRGDHLARRIHLVRWIDQSGVPHFSAAPSLCDGGVPQGASQVEDAHGTVALAGGAR